MMRWYMLVLVSRHVTARIYVCACEGEVSLPNEMSPIGHSPNCAHCTTDAGEPECASRLS